MHTDTQTGSTRTNTGDPMMLVINSLETMSVDATMPVYFVRHALDTLKYAQRLAPDGLPQDVLEGAVTAYARQAKFCLKKGRNDHEGLAEIVRGFDVFVKATGHDQRLAEIQVHRLPHQVGRYMELRTSDITKDILLRPKCPLACAALENYGIHLAAA